ncbi:MAG: hypothetical protein ACE5HQ_11880 [Gemmatimonadota bacterium]
MSTTGIVTMLFVLAFVWGGFVLILATAARKERRKTEEGSSGTR